MSFPERPFGFVAGRWVHSIGDTPDDPDRAPDYVPVKEATVVFTPQVTHRVATDGSGWAGIIKERVSARVGERGQLIDAEGHDHLALAVGIYSVSYDFGSGGSWPSHYIEVKPEHTADAPLWLPPIAPPPEGPRIENRVITIPADGEDGQVLVWDGAGFSWMDAPEGPRGPAGEVTTAALTTALAGKVTGTGMTLRHDNSVGTRVFLDYPGGSTMLYGDTGWRDVSGLLEPGVLIDSPVRFARIRNINGIVHFQGNISIDPATLVDGRIITLPPGWRPGKYGTWGQSSIGAVATIVSTSMITLRGWTDQTNASFSASWPATYPTTLPGTPA